MMANPVGERRRHERVPCAASVACCPFTSSGEIIWYGRTEDVSGGGIRLVVGRRFRRGTVLRLVLRGRAEEEPTRLLVRVRRAEAAGDGAWSLGCQLAAGLEAADLEPVLRTAAVA